MAARKSIHDHGYAVLVEILRNARKSAGVTQVELSRRLGRPQSFVSRYEQAERRLDIMEVREICRSIGADFLRVVEALDRAL